VTIADVQDAAAEKAAAELTAKGYHVSFVHCDTTDWESSVAAFKHAASFGPRETLDVAVLNAGIEGDKGSIADQVLAAPEPSLDSDVVPVRPTRKGTAVNFLGVYDNCWLALHYMRLPAKVGPPKASKSLIMTGSLASYADMPTNTDYNAAKCEYFAVLLFY
jgi:5'-hydroxyaverantin dehydrogenase